MGIRMMGRRIVRAVVIWMGGVGSRCMADGVLMQLE